MLSCVVGRGAPLLPNLCTHGEPPIPARGGGTDPRVQSQRGKLGGGGAGPQDPIPAGGEQAQLHGGRSG